MLLRSRSRCHMVYVPCGLGSLALGATWHRCFTLVITWPTPTHNQGVTWLRTGPIISAMWLMWCTFINTMWSNSRLSLNAMYPRFRCIPRCHLGPSLGFTLPTTSFVLKQSISSLIVLSHIHAGYNVILLKLGLVTFGIYHTNIGVMNVEGHIGNIRPLTNEKVE
jgi:hypothetical protein